MLKRMRWVFFPAGLLIIIGFLLYAFSGHDTFLTPWLSRPILVVGDESEWEWVPYFDEQNEFAGCLVDHKIKVIFTLPENHQMEWMIRGTYSGTVGKWEYRSLNAEPVLLLGSSIEGHTTEVAVRIIDFFGAVITQSNFVVVPLPSLEGCKAHFVVTGSKDDDQQGRHIDLDFSTGFDYQPLYEGKELVGCTVALTLLTDLFSIPSPSEVMYWRKFHGTGNYLPFGDYEEQQVDLADNTIVFSSAETAYIGGVQLVVFSDDQFVGKSSLFFLKVPSHATCKGYFSSGSEV